MSTLYHFIEKKDWLLYQLLNSSNKNQSVFKFMRLVTHLGDTLASFIYIYIAFLMSAHCDKPIFPLIAGAVVFTQIPVQVIKRLVNRKRPYHQTNLVFVYNPPKCQYSFPSGHTACAFSVAWILLMSYPVFGLFALVLASLVGISRIVLGYHFPTDVLIGCLLALCGASLSYLLIA